MEAGDVCSADSLASSKKLCSTEVRSETLLRLWTLWWKGLHLGGGASLLSCFELWLVVAGGGLPSTMGTRSKHVLSVRARRL